MSICFFVCFRDNKYRQDALMRNRNKIISDHSTKNCKLITNMNLKSASSERIGPGCFQVEHQRMGLATLKSGKIHHADWYFHSEILERVRWFLSTYRRKLIGLINRYMEAATERFTFCSIAQFRAASRGFDPRFVLYCWAPRPPGGRTLWEPTQWAMAAHVQRCSWQTCVTCPPPSVRASPLFCCFCFCSLCSETLFSTIPFR
jgi:hypothetical protein